MGLSKFSRQNPNKRALNRDEFVIVFRESYNLLDSYRISTPLLWRFFDKIDTDHDGHISYLEFSDWIRNFLAALSISSDDFYFESDDENLEKGINSISSQTKTNQVKVESVVPTFSDLDLARRARLRCLQLIESFDTNKNRNMEQYEIIAILKILMKSDEFDVFYVVANVFRYDANEDGFVNYNELTDFFLELHNGELALQRLHKVNKFSKGDQRILNLPEFEMLMDYGLSFIDIKATKEELSTLFGDIDSNKTGWISYQQFLEFLKDYFGARSLVRIESTNKKDEKVETLVRKDSLSSLSAGDKFARLVIDELTKILKNYTAFQTLDKQEIIRFLK